MLDRIFGEDEGLRNLNECGAWIATQFKDFRYGLIMDPLVMLDRIFGEDEASSSTHLKTMETRINLKIMTGAEAATLYDRCNLSDPGSSTAVTQQ